MVTKRQIKKATKTPVRTLADIRGGNVLAKPNEVCQVLRIHRMTVHRLCERGELQGTKVGEELRVLWDSVEALINRGYQKPTPATASA